MDIKLPDNLVFEESRLVIVFLEDARVNRSKSSVMIKGTRGGFLSLANALLYFLNELQDSIPIHSLPYVSGDVSLVVECDYSPNSPAHGTVLQTGQRQFSWKLSEANLCEVAAAIHSLGHVNNELHLDEGNHDEITVYCVVE